MPSLTPRRSAASTVTAFWRRLDVPGHDACRLRRSADGWCLRGAAVFRHAAGPAHLSYSVRCDGFWNAGQGRVAGFIGPRHVRYALVRTARGWTVNGTLVRALPPLVDLDFDFTPATNRLHLARAEACKRNETRISAAWFDVESGTLSRLDQSYERRGPSAYWYRAPTADYAGLLEFGATGFVRRYPSLWEAEDEAEGEHTAP